MKEKMYALRVGDMSRPACVVCGGRVSLNGTVGWRRTCSVRCAARDPATRERTKRTAEERYGGHHTQTAEWKQQVKERVEAGSFKKGIETLERRYGVRSVFALPDVKRRSQQTLQERYGVTNAQQVEEVKARTRRTRIERYGRPGGPPMPMGDANPMRQPAVVFQSRCNKMAQVDWQELERDKQFTFIGILGGQHQWRCLSCGSDNVSDRLNATCYCQRQTIEAESVRWLRETGDEVVTNSRKVVPGIELDIYCPQHKVAIELNGTYWHSETILAKRVENPRHYHRMKHDRCKQAGIHLLQFTDMEWTQQPDIVRSMVSHKLGCSGRRVGARSCQVVEVSGAEAGEFMKRCHIGGSAGATLHLGLRRGDSLVAVGSFGRSRFGAGVELIRFACELGTSVPGGLARLIAASRERLGWQELTSYCDLRYGTGASYLRLGFRVVSEGAPGYWYIDFKRGKVLSRLGFQKKRLKERLETYDETLTEWQNMQLAGYDRIWDAGHLKLVLVVQ